MSMGFYEDLFGKVEGTERRDAQISTECTYLCFVLPRSFGLYYQEQ